MPRHAPHAPRAPRAPGTPGVDVATDTAAARRPYHHGRLRQALVEAALALAEEKGPEGVSVREAARRIGVSPSAPFRHFPSRRALMTAVAIEAGERLQLEARRRLARAGASPLERLHALGEGYLAWSQRHPTHFRIVSARDQLDVDGDPRLQASMQSVRDWALALMAEGLQAGSFQPAAQREDPAALALFARATVYGLARMHLDGHLPQWGVAAGDEPEALAAQLALLMRLLGRPALVAEGANAPEVAPAPELRDAGQ